MDCAEKLRTRAVILGWITTIHGWCISNETQKLQAVWEALLDVAINHLHIPSCLGGVVAQGVQKLTRLPKEATSSLVMHWLPEQRDNLFFHQFQGNVDIKVGRDLGCQQTWRSVSFVQFHFYNQTMTQQLRDEDPGIPQLGAFVQRLILY
jgi:hypothetical protein